jgi:DNA invertase Pin-like site-specific DNA recombinase
MESREGLLQAIRHANEIGATILITELHRLSRSVRDIAGLLDAKVKFIITQSGQQISKPMILMMAVLAETTRDQISQSTSRGIQALFDRDPEAKANWGGARRPDQANEDMTRGRINRADKFALENGDFAFLLRREGMSYHAIAEIYTAKPNYTTSRGNQTWNGTQIRQMVLRYERLINNEQ